MPASLCARHRRRACPGKPYPHCVSQPSASQRLDTTFTWAGSLGSGPGDLHTSAHRVRQEGRGPSRRAHAACTAASPPPGTRTAGASCSRPPRTSCSPRPPASVRAGSRDGGSPPAGGQHGAELGGGANHAVQPVRPAPPRPLAREAIGAVHVAPVLLALPVDRVLHIVCLVLFAIARPMARKAKHGLRLATWRLARSASQALLHGTRRLLRTYSCGQGERRRSTAQQRTIPASMCALQKRARSPAKPKLAHFPHPASHLFAPTMTCRAAQRLSRETA